MGLDDCFSEELSAKKDATDELDATPEQEYVTDQFSAKADSTGELDMFNSNSIVWMPDKSAASCSKCNEAFTMLRRRHHCRACGEVCCAQCAPRTSSTWSSLLKRSPEQSLKRVCKECSGGMPTSVQEHAPSSITWLVKNTFIDIKDATIERRLRSDTLPY